MIFQFFNLPDDLTVADNVLSPAQRAGLPKAHTCARTNELLARLRIEQLRQAYPTRLSGGERQWVASARALMNRPKPAMVTRWPVAAPTVNIMDPGFTVRAGDRGRFDQPACLVARC